MSSSAARLAADSAQADYVVQLARLVLQSWDAAALDLAQRLCVSVGTPASVGTDLLAPTARLLGDLWTDDRVDFTQVTIGVWRLQQLAHELDPLRDAAIPAGGMRGQALLACIAGDQHSFGRLLVASAFRRAGWFVDDGSEPTVNDVCRRASSAWFDVVGFSLGSARGLEEVRASIRALRRSSRNPAIGVLVGGAPFLAAPDLAQEVGADGTATDAAEAVRRAESFVRPIVGR